MRPSIISANRSSLDRSAASKACRALCHGLSPRRTGPSPGQRRVRRRGLRRAARPDPHGVQGCEPGRQLAEGGTELGFADPVPDVATTPLPTPRRRGPSHRSRLRRRWGCWSRLRRPRRRGSRRRPTLGPAGSMVRAPRPRVGRNRFGVDADQQTGCPSSADVRSLQQLRLSKQARHPRRFKRRSTSDYQRIRE